MWLICDIGRERVEAILKKPEGTKSISQQKEEKKTHKKNKLHG
jgi:hypothetical protein